MLTGTNGRKYKVEQRLNHGGFGKIFQGIAFSVEDPRRAKIVAIKFVQVLNQVQEQLLSEEIAILELLASKKRFLRLEDHLAVVYGPNRSEHALVMNLLGPNLVDVFSSQELKPIRDFFMHKNQLYVQTLKCLRDLHIMDILHCDIKLQNFCIGPLGESRLQIHLIDFGLSINMQSEATEEELASRRSIARGTLAYMSPYVQRRELYSEIDDLISLFYSLVDLVISLPWKHERDAQQTMLHKLDVGFVALGVTTNVPLLSAFGRYIDRFIYTSPLRTRKVNYVELFAVLFATDVQT